MKKLIALVLAALMLLSAAACAESPSITLVLSDVALTHIEGGRSETTRVPELTVQAAIGMSDLTPSIQATFIFGDADQELGATLQLSGTQLLASVGSISSVFALDLEKLLGDADAAQVAAMAISSTISLGGFSLAAAISALTHEGEDGARVATVDIPTERLVAMADSALEKAGGLDAADRIDFDAIRARLQDLSDTVQMEIRFNPATGDFAVTLSGEDRALRLDAVAKVANGPFTYADVDLSADRVDVTNLTDADIQKLNDEASLLFGRLINMAAAMGLGKYIPEK